MRLLQRLSSTRLSLRVGLAMIIPLVLGLVIAYAVFAQLEQDHERSSTATQDLANAKIIANSLTSTPRTSNLEIMQKLLGDDQLIVVRNNVEIFRGPPNSEHPNIPVTYSTSYGKVTVIGDIDSTATLTVELTIIAALLLLFVLASAAFGTRVLLRSVTEPVKRATQVAQRVAAGDFSVRIDARGNDEFGQLAMSFDTMTSRLEDTDRTQRQFLVDLAHEIATPLNTIAGVTLGILDGTINLQSAREEGQEIVEIELDRIRLLLGDVRSLGLIESTQVIRKEQVDLGIVGERAIRRFTREAHSRHIAIAGRTRSVNVRSDQRLIETIVDNFLSNALRYTPEGGKIDLTVLRRSHEAIIAVSDTGVGISPSQKDLIFERFYRTDSARDREHGGTGLGLAIARRAAIAIGGRLEVDSTPGKGSEFRLVVPISRQGE